MHTLGPFRDPRCTGLAGGPPPITGRGGFYPEYYADAMSDKWMHFFVSIHEKHRYQSSHDVDEGSKYGS